MSTPISKTIGAALVCVALGACVGGTGGAERSVLVTSAPVRVGGPSGLCVDPTATRSSGDTGFVLLGNCAVVSGSRFAAQPAVPAVLTAAISAPGDAGEISGNLEALDGFFRSDEGRGLLSRSGDRDTVTVLGSAVEGNVFYLHARDSARGPIDGVGDSYWRAYLDLGDRIATLTILARAEQPLSDTQSLDTLRQFVAAIQSANATISTESTASPQGSVAATTNSAPATGGGLWNSGLFRRILR